MNFKSWLNEQSYAGIEDADSSQIERVYKKSRLAVKIVQDYDKQTGNNYLTNITTIAPISRAGIFGLYNSAENKAIIGKPFNQQKFTFSQEEIEKMKSLPEDVLRQHGIPDEVIKSLTPTDTIHVNVLNIYDTFNKAQKAGKMSPEEAQINIIRKLPVPLSMKVRTIKNAVRPEKQAKPVLKLRNRSFLIGLIKTYPP